MELKGRVLGWVTIAITVGSSLSGCNALEWADSPSGDAQYLSAARACFDQGNYTCASSNYSKLSTASSDQKISEEAFLSLAQNGVTAGVFMRSALSGSSSGGKLVTYISNAIGTATRANEEGRLEIFHAYQTSADIVDTRVRGLVQFITAISLAAELLQEDATTAGDLAKSDLVSDPTACLANQLSSGCNAPSGKKLTVGTEVGTGSSKSLLNATDSQMSGDPTLYMINAAITAAQEGLSNMQTTGSLGSSASSFSSEVTNVALGFGADAPLYRNILIAQGVGK